MSRRILLVEDEPGIRGNLREMLEAEGYAVREACDGAEGVLRCQEEPPDLVICDIMMPGKDGYQVLAELREDPETLEIPFLFLSAKADRGSHRRGMEMGAEDYLTKPFTRTDLLAAVEARLRRADGLTARYRAQIARMRGLLGRSLPHELITPLNGILGLSAILVEEYESIRRGEVLDLAKGIVDSGESLLKLVRRFLQLSELQLCLSDPEALRRLRAMRVPSPDAKCREAILETMRALGRDREMRVSGDGSEAPMQEGHLALSAVEIASEWARRTVPGTPLDFFCGAEGPVWCLVVQATGVRMDPGELEALMRGEGPGDGAGMGLATLRAVAEVYAGEIELGGFGSEGTFLALRIPRLQAA